MLRVERRHENHPSQPGDVRRPTQRDRDRDSAVRLAGDWRKLTEVVAAESVDRIIYSIFQRFNLEWKTRTRSVFTQAA